VALLPVDSSSQPAADSLGLTRAYLVRSLLGSGAGNLLVILDMCRNVIPMAPGSQPAAWQNENLVIGPAGSKGLRRILREGNSPARPDQGYLVAYSTSGDQLAFDNGSFSRILAEEIRRPRQNIADALKRTSDRVALNALKDGRNFQKPTFDYGLQGAPPCFVSCDVGAEGRFYDCANCPYMRIVPKGMARIGAAPAEPGRGGDEPAATEVSISRPFAISVYEVSVSEWAACVRDGACRPVADWTKENPNPLMPAAGISHADATAYATWLAAQTGLPYRLPTETEWEYAARGGAATTFAWGDAITPSNANYDHSASYAGSPTAPYRGYPEAINAYPPNDFGLYQMSGNVWEWTDGCADPACKARVARGGSFDSAPDELRAANRFGISGGRKRDDVGVRVVRDLAADETGR
jgi:formylglycine-generating enzyme required for sulfatase activity